ncbi:MAG: endonuclease [SAR324 cluster bacterium]|nr:endonuclease [SAR324 cluster bacterium]
MKFLLAILVTFYSACCFPANVLARGNQVNSSFNKSKQLLRSIYQNHRVTLYCGCQYDEQQRPDLQSCGYKPRKSLKRASRIEWEHVVPASVFGRLLKEWREGSPDCISKKGKPYKGRRCANKLNLQYRFMQADMYNLYPSIGEVNGDRKNYEMSTIPGEKRRYGQCDVEIQNRTLEPRPEIRGNIARIYFYMDSTYPGFGIVSNENRNLFEDWNRIDPADQLECERGRKIKAVQGNPNEIVEKACHAIGL